MATARHDELIEAARRWADADERVRALLLKGSLGRGGGDARSDVDLVVVTRAGRMAELWDERNATAESLGRWLGGFDEMPWQAPHTFIGFYDGPVKVDFFYQEGEPAADAWLRDGFAALVDPDGVSESLRARLSGAGEAVDLSTFDAHAWDWLWWMDVELGRGDETWLVYVGFVRFAETMLLGGHNALTPEPWRGAWRSRRACPRSCGPRSRAACPRHQSRRSCVVPTQPPSAPTNACATAWPGSGTCRWQRARATGQEQPRRSLIPMRAEGLEPPRLAPRAPKARVSTNFTTPAQGDRRRRTGPVATNRRTASAGRGRLRSGGAVSDAVLTHPNRDKPESKATKAIIVLLLLATAGLVAIVTLGGWSVLQGAQPVAFAYILVLLVMAYYVYNWNRGVLPVAAALATLFTVLALVAAPAWFARDKAGFPTRRSSPASSACSP